MAFELIFSLFDKKVLMCFLSEGREKNKSWPWLAPRTQKNAVMHPAARRAKKDWSRTARRRRGDTTVKAVHFQWLTLIFLDMVKRHCHYRWKVDVQSENGWCTEGLFFVVFWHWSVDLAKTFPATRCASFVWGRVGSMCWRLCGQGRSKRNPMKIKTTSLNFVKGEKIKS